MARRMHRPGRNSYPREGNNGKMHRNQRQCRRSSELDEQGCPFQIKHITLLEKKYCELLKSRGSFDHTVRGARVSLRDSYEDLILNSNSSTYAADVEQALWRLHYRGIEEFRNKIRMLSPSPSSRGNRSNGHQESLLRIVNSFKGFLDETTGYFHGLIVKLRAKYGLPATHSPGEGLMCMKSTDGLCHCAISCHRVFIYLGDLARYGELYGVQDPNRRNWTIAANYYMQAAALCPFSGNPHNQLAVLATYTGDTLSAIYHYCRSLAVDVPFVTARENLILLLEKKQKHVCKVSSIVEGSGQLSYLIAAVEREDEEAGGTSHFSRHKDNLQLIGEGESNIVAIKEIWECFLNHFIQLASAIFTKSCIEELEDAVSKSKSAVQQLFYHCSRDLEKAFLSKQQYPREGCTAGKTPILKIVIILIVLIHDAHEQFQNAAAMSENLHVSILFRFFLLIMSLLVNKAANSEDGEVNFLLPGVIVFMEWVACQSSFLHDLKVDAAIAKELSDFKQKAKLLCAMLLKQKTCLDKGEVNMVTDITLRRTTQAALWEDYELLGFSPLASAQQDLDFSNLCTARDGTGTLQVCLQRFMNALKAFNNFRGFAAVDIHPGSPHDETDCNTEGIAISVEPECNLKETTVVLDPNPTTSLKDWVPTSNENLLASDLPSVSGVEKSNNVNEDSSTICLAVAEECETSKIDGPVSLEPMSLNNAPEIPRQKAGSELFPEDAFIDVTNHPPSPVRCSQYDNQPTEQQNLTQQCFKPQEIPQGASLLNNNGKDPIAVYNGTEISDDEKASAAEDPVSNTQDHRQRLDGCLQDGKQSNINNVTQACILQSRQDPVSSLQEAAFPSSYTKDFVALCYKTKVYKDESKRTSLPFPMFTGADNSISRKSPDVTPDVAEASSSQLFFRAKEQLVEDLKWLDDYTHVKPAGLQITWRGLDNEFPIFNSSNKRKRAGDDAFRMIFNTQEMKQYQSQNPFVARLNRQTH